MPITSETVRVFTDGSCCCGPGSGHGPYSGVEAIPPVVTCCCPNGLPPTLHLTLGGISDAGPAGHCDCWDGMSIPIIWDPTFNDPVGMGSVVGAYVTPVQSPCNTPSFGTIWYAFAWCDPILCEWRTKNFYSDDGGATWQTDNGSGFAASSAVCDPAVIVFTGIGWNLDTFNCSADTATVTE